jgi:hypothetical protein
MPLVPLGYPSTFVYDSASVLQRHKKAQTLTYNRLKKEIKTFKDTAAHLTNSLKA